MKSLKLFSILAVLMLLAAFVPAASAQTTYSNATVQGKYQFQFTGVSNPYGYYTNCDSNNNCTWVPVNNGNCPTNENCQNNPTIKFTFGYFEFDGNGKITFLAFSGFNPGSSTPNQGGTGYGTYTVGSAGNGSINLTITGATGGGCTVTSPCTQSGIVFYFNAAQTSTGVAQVLVLHSYPNPGSGSGDTNAGEAFHQ